MNREVFNPLDWLQSPKKESIGTASNNTSQFDEVIELVNRIEEQQLDIAAAYSDWRNIGFAFADAFGEGGRELFHRISHFYPEYSMQECNKQYDACLKSKGTGISLKTFFYHASKAGIKGNSTANANAEVQEPANLPTFPESLYPELPDFLQSAVSVSATAEERDLILLGSLCAISACLPNFYGFYDGRKVFPNLFLFVTAQASAGKGRLVHCKQLILPIHKELREQAKLLKQQYELQMIEYNSKKGKDDTIEKPAKPAEKMLIIPANNSTTGVFQLLSDNEGKGLIFETEGDTLAQAFKSDYGNYSDGFRKAFHHETISYYRRTDREYVDIESPCLSAVLSGTPKQVSALIPNAENGLLSRFIFYYMNLNPQWKDVFAEHAQNGLDQHFTDLSNPLLNLYHSLKSQNEMVFTLTAEQKHQFNGFFTQVQNTYLAVQGLDYMATIRRLGLIAYRITMILSALRIIESGEISGRIICEDRDFKTALAMIRVLVKHSSKVFSELPETPKPASRKNRKEKFLEALPKSFNRQAYLEVARKLEIPDKTAEGYITEFHKKGLVHREHHDQYLNVSSQGFKETEEPES